MAEIKNPSECNLEVYVERRLPELQGVDDATNTFFIIKLSRWSRQRGLRKMSYEGSATSST